MMSTTKQLTFIIHGEQVDYDYVLGLCKGNKIIAADIWGLVLNDAHTSGEGNMIHPATHLEECINEGEYIEHEGKLYNFRVEYDIDYTPNWEHGCHFITKRPFFYSPGGHLGLQLDKAADFELPENLADSDDPEYIESQLDKYFIWERVYMYDHSGQTISTSPFSCRWDSGQIGWIVYDKNQVRKDYGWTRITQKRENQIIQYLEGVVKDYDNVLRGYVYGFINDDSCWGFVGDPYGKEGQDLFSHIAEHANVPVEVVEKAFDNL